MAFLTYLLCLFYFYIQSCHGEITMTQIPEHISVSPGENAVIHCTPSSTVTNSAGTSFVHWYQKKQDQSPTLLIYRAINRQSGVPERFSGGRSGSPYNDFTLTISGALAEDEAHYYCHQSWEAPHTFGGGTNLEVKQREDHKPTVSIYPAAVEQIVSGTASIVCMIQGFYPADAEVTWKVDNTVINDGVLNSDKVKDTKDNTYSKSSTLTMTSAQYKSHDLFTCEVTHKTLTSALVTSFKASECNV